MQELTRKNITFVIDNLKKVIKRKDPKIYWANNPMLRQIYLEQNKHKIHGLLLKLREHHAELLPYVKKMKSYIIDITESTHICAIYLLLCHIFENWNSFFLLAENGKSSAASNLLRMIEEAIEQVNLFSIEFLSGDSSNLNKWLSGNIIDQGTCRKALGKFNNNILPELKFSREKLTAHIYQMISQASHNAYATILELVSPFTEDFDYDGYAGFHRTIACLKLGSLSSTNIALKAVYKIVIKDAESFAKLDDILIKYDPQINDRINEDHVKDFIK